MWKLPGVRDESILAEGIHVTSTGSLDPFNPPGHPQEGWDFVSFRWENWNSKNISDLPKDTPYSHLMLLSAQDHGALKISWI